MNLSCKRDDYTGSIGKRYARTDEIGVPFIFTVDFDTTKISDLNSATVTIRERNSTEQIRAPVFFLLTFIYLYLFFRFLMLLKLFLTLLIIIPIIL